MLCDETPDAAQHCRATAVLNNWRSCHGYPINTFQATLRDKLKKIDTNALVAQRLKRSPSIIRKLQRFAGMQLARMQDIGGLRAVVGTLGMVRDLEQSYRESRFAHELIAERDYITNPKPSGYRSVHLIYRYKNSRTPDYNGLLIELQIRTRLQHAWATAVETMGTFLDHALKSSEGPQEWLTFFSLTGSGFAHLEGCTPVPGYESLSRKQTFRKVATQATRLTVKERLTAFSIAADAIAQDTTRRSHSYHLIVLDPVKRSVTITSYARGRLMEASRDYTQEELRIRDGEPLEVVLVSAGPIDALRRAYPNFFLDTHEFIKELTRMEKLAKAHANKAPDAKG